MQLVLTLIAAPGSGLVTEGAVGMARETLEHLGARVGESAWLARGEACDLAFERPAADGLETILRSRLPRLDIAIQPRQGRRKALLLADMDSTIVTSETLDELAAYAGLKEKIAAITARAMAGELDFAEALRTRVGLLKGLPAESLDKTLEQVRLTSGASALVNTMRAEGAYCALISGGFSHFTRSVAARCGFHEERSNHLLVEEGKLCGRVAEPILGKEAKLATLRELLSAHGLSGEQACTVGDGANDIPMLRAAGLGVAFRGKPAVREAAPFRIDQGDLTALLYLQGYRRDEFVA